MTQARVIHLCSRAAPALPERLAAWAGARRLLAVRVDSLAGVLMTTPALAAAREAAPHLHITLLGSGTAREMAPHLPVVDDVITASVPWVRQEGGCKPWQDDAVLLDRLSEGRFDAAVIFTLCTQSALPAALLCRLAGIPLRLAQCRDDPYGLLTDWVEERDLDLARVRHEVRRQLDLVAHVGWTTPDERLRFTVRDEDTARIDALLGQCGQLVVVHVGAGTRYGRYPPERFGAVAEAIARETGARIVFTGSASEAALADLALCAMTIPARSLAGGLSLGEFAALLARASLLVSNDSGPVHLAAAVGTPVVDLGAATYAQHAPWRVRSRVLRHDVPCSHCFRSHCPLGHRDCLLWIPAHAVRDAALELLADPPPAVPLAFRRDTATASRSRSTQFARRAEE
jgi:ADP-heptose:LPS heptosyltransferase